MRIAVVEAEPWEERGFAALAAEHEVTCTGERLTAATAGLLADAEVISPFVHSRLDRACLDALPALRLVATRSTGFDHIDLEACAGRGITVCNVPDYGDHTVAEHAFALLLALSRRVCDAAERTRRGRFDQAGLRGFDLRGRVLGIVGTGRIGRRAIEIGRGFGMTVIAADPFPNEPEAARLGFRYVPFDELLASADVISLHVPSTPATRHLLDDAAFEKVKPGCVLINTARGAVVDVEALVRALADGRIAAAGLDVLPDEPAMRDEAEVFRRPAGEDGHDLKALLASHVLLRFPNVIVTPHIAYDTTDAVERILAATLANIRAFAAGRPQNVVLARS